MPLELEMILRIVMSAVLGFAIGYERKLRLKEAGIRTHTIVTMGACLFTLISIYGFSSLGANDAGRVAAQVVSGIGFLGAGMIMYRREALSGLTTAAGIWATAGVGMCAGAGLYILAAVSAALIIFLQCIFHLPLKIFKTKHSAKVRIRFTFLADEDKLIREAFGVDNCLKLSMLKQENETEGIMDIRIIGVIDLELVKRIYRENKFIKEIRILGDE